MQLVPESTADRGLLPSEVKVVRVEPDPNLTYRKGGYDGKHFVGTRVLVLEDGRRVVNAVAHRRKKDLVAELADLPEDVDNMSVKLDDDGRLLFVTTSYRLGG